MFVCSVALLRFFPFENSFHIIIIKEKINKTNHFSDVITIAYWLANINTPDGRRGFFKIGILRIYIIYLSYERNGVL